MRRARSGLKTPPRDSLALHRLLEKQYYRLAYWRVASDEINYRRFFEITDLAGVRVEDAHGVRGDARLVARLAKGGGIDGVRIDHPDGLADPKQYFEWLSGALSAPALDRDREDPRRPRARCPRTGRCTARPATASSTS